MTALPALPALSARGVTLPGRLQPTDLDLAPATLTAVIGPNGAGKTSLLHAIAGIGRAAGRVRIRGRDRDSFPARARPGVLGYVPASRELAWPVTVRAFLALTAPNAADAELEAVLARLDLAALAHRRVDSLSTGERTRVLVARALLPRPSVLLLDEPFANLDPLWQLRLSALLRDEADRGATLLLSVHDLDLASRIADRVLVVDAGEIVGDGVWDELTDVVTRVFGVSRASSGWVRAG